ncbi:2og-fe oxygenase family [Fusarium albosuccineum]|uniref:2og-fe oxygenase family n=1 Tax=Fusarium albosuccineum TaxID=1237068 RepID=A0A8H4KIL6_9HYPO|nr:2og-fe oxygenase family [Fusarium albosuccineum]
MDSDKPPSHREERPSEHASQSSSQEHQDSPQPEPHHPVGWSLQNEEYESPSEEGTDTDTEEEHETSSADSDDQDGSDSLKELRCWLKSNYNDTVFACGGRVPIDAQDEQPLAKETLSRPASVSSDSSSLLTIPSATPHVPVTLRWDPRDDSTPATHCKLTMPTVNPDNLEHLLSEMMPATFGRGGEDVHDESYRKASKLEPSNLSTNFCPYTVGIIDAVSQLLLPNREANKQRAVKAELYKLNVYTGPSGHFRPHVDTPRSRSQFGSLVVCLPVEHEGGTLEVRHGDQTISFDWASSSGSSNSSIQWAAFYSDCEHEVLPVTSGHRITLTYNLYIARGNTQLSSEPNALDITQTPLYRELEGLLNDKYFLPDGGYIGFYTTHAYPHTSSHGSLADTLKGLDMAIWQAFQHLGCGVCLRPVLAAAPFYQQPRSFDLGKKFDIKALSRLIETPDEWGSMLKDDWGLERVSFNDVVWLNKPNLDHEQVSFAYTAASLAGDKPKQDRVSVSLSCAGFSHQWEGFEEENRDRARDRMQNKKEVVTAARAKDPSKYNGSRNVILLYEILTEHVRSLKRYGSLKAYAILNALEIVFWGAVVFLMIQANIKYCVGTNCALSWVVVVLGIILNMLASYMAVCTKWKKDQGTSHVGQVNTNITRAQIDMADKDRHTTAHVHRRQIQTIGGLTTGMAKREDRLRPTTIVHIKHHAPLRLHIHLHIDTHTL